MRRPDVRLAMFGLSALLAVYVGFIGLSVPAAESFLKRSGYYVMLGTFVLGAASVWRAGAGRFADFGNRLQTAAVILVGIVLTVAAIAHESIQSKILFDEYVLQSTAFNMHYFREVVTMVRGYDIQGVFLSTDNYLDKRPYFFPFLISVVHDVSGYRPTNAYILNAILFPAALGLVFLIGNRLAGWRGGILAMLLLGTLPLFAQNASGAGMELINVVMLLLCVLLGARYFREPEGKRLLAFTVAVVLFAQTRYESPMYVLPAAVLIVLGWVRAGRVILPWSILVVPWLLLPVALQHRVVAATPWLWELKETQSERFSFEYLMPNLESAAGFLFSTSPQQANSLLLVIAGTGALIWIALLLVRGVRGWRMADPTVVSLVLFSCGILANTALVQCYYWAGFSDPMAARFSLPLNMLLAFGVVHAVRRLDPKFPAMKWAIVAVCIHFVGFSAPKQAYHLYSNVGMYEIEWEIDRVARRQAGPTIVVTNKSTLPWLLRKTPSILIGRAVLMADRLEEQLRGRTFSEILVTQSLRPSSIHGDHQIVPEDALPPWFKLETVEERRFGTKIARISRLVSIESAVANAGAALETRSAPAEPGESQIR